MSKETNANYSPEVMEAWSKVDTDYVKDTAQELREYADKLENK